MQEDLAFKLDLEPHNRLRRKEEKMEAFSPLGDKLAARRVCRKDFWSQEPWEAAFNSFYGLSA